VPKPLHKRLRKRIRRLAYRFAHTLPAFVRAPLKQMLGR
jgi:hypothetical protein